MISRILSSALRTSACANSISCIRALYWSLVLTSSDWSRNLPIFCWYDWISDSTPRRLCSCDFIAVFACSTLAFASES